MGVYPSAAAPAARCTPTSSGNLRTCARGDTRFVAVSRGEQEHLQRYRGSMS